MAEIEWTEDAENDLDKLDINIAKRIVRKATWIAANFDNIVPEPLEGKFKGKYKYRVGDYRIVYSLEHNTIVIEFVGHRSIIYR